MAKLLDLDVSAALRRVRVASREGYLINQEDRKGRRAQLVLGDPMPNEMTVLPHPDAVERAQGGISSPQFRLQPCNPAIAVRMETYWQARYESYLGTATAGIHLYT